MADETRSNTATNSEGEGEGQPKQRGKPFTKGDPRINRKGRPKSFDALRKLAQQVGCEVVVAKDNSVAMSRVELILRDWSSSKDARKQQAFMEVAYGKVPNPVELEQKGATVIRVIREDKDDQSEAEALAREATADAC